MVKCVYGLSCDRESLLFVGEIDSFECAPTWMGFLIVLFGRDPAFAERGNMHEVKTRLNKLALNKLWSAC